MADDAANRPPPDDEGSSDESEDFSLDPSIIAQIAGMGLTGDGGPGIVPALKPRPPLLTSFDLAGVAEHITSGKAKKIVVMIGAGCSVSAGIPDFRTPGTGLYYNLQKYDLDYPHQIFELDYFKSRPEAFCALAREMWPGSFAPTAAHYFVRLLHDKGLLQACFSQNIDSLEREAGLPEDAVVAAHGNFDAARCVASACGASAPVAAVKAAILAGEVPRCAERACGGLIKPEIVFFGEALPKRFFVRRAADFLAADLLIVMGTSLKVQPFASLIDHVGPDVPRCLINREKVGEARPVYGAAPGAVPLGFDFAAGSNFRDALFLGDCDAGARELAARLGWADELEALVQSRRPAEGLEAGGGAA